MLLNDEIDIGLVPVAVIPLMKEHHIITDYCIGTEGEVASVALFSQSPIEKTERILLDYQSRTSVALAKILLKYHWKLDIPVEDAKEDFGEQIQGNIAGVMIGDRALEQRKRSAYIYDLGLAWKEMTGLPFVFAAWVANKKLDEGFINEFNAANKYGVAHIKEVLAESHFNGYDLETYYTKNISYRLTDKKREALQKFLGLLKEGTVS